MTVAIGDPIATAACIAVSYSAIHPQFMAAGAGEPHLSCWYAPDNRVIGNVAGHHGARGYESETANHHARQYHAAGAKRSAELHFDPFG